MLVTFFCTHCDAKLRITADAMGSPLVCPECDSELQIPNMQLGPGFVVGGFLIKHKLGEGGMGEVYLATQLSLERDVALKILPSRYTQQRSFVVRFLKEVHYQAKLDHPNVVAAFDAGEDSGVYYMAMAYVEGKTLEELLEQDGPMGENPSLEIVKQVALALKYASEEKGLLHRDIKPANIMVSTSMQAKVLDMGLSKNTLEKSSNTVADTLLGTLNYMSPEQIDHPNNLDSRSDMFSLGMTLYHMLTGTVPFQDTSYLKTLKRHASEMLEDPRSLMPGISTATVHVLARLLARDPDDRYATWDALLEDVDHVLNRTAIPPLPQGASSVMVSAERTLADAAASTPPVEEDIEPDLESERKRTTRGVVLSVLIGVAVGALGVLIASRTMNRGQEPEPIIVEVPVPVTPEPLPVLPTPEPTPVSLESQSRLARIILDYETTPGQYDLTLEKLRSLAKDVEDPEVAEETVFQMMRIRKDRDLAVDLEQRRIREETRQVLDDEGVDAANAYLDTLETPFSDEMQPHIRRLRRMVREQGQKDEALLRAEKLIAQKALDAKTREMIPMILQREWTHALDELKKVARDPAFFPVLDEVAALRGEIKDLRDVAGKVQEEFEKLEGELVMLELQTRWIELEIVEVNEVGLRGVREIKDDVGTPLGTVEEDIAFSQLAAAEVVRRLEALEGSAIEITKGLIAHRDGKMNSCLNALDEAGTPLANAIRQELYPLPTLDSF